ncbi:ATP-binding protein [Marinobacter sp. 1_MG-2023]|uniref:hybrid sensor histidine kinase/response regulator n=1 Tax=Marinobacter sp. 1_MG-2023 TaxID=3062627 RepID=UPI0026E22331|nr:ATP-binding protein [Marinobacter sp. 1_MG-2023]MDO6823564.1 ATP-binding protein [Marinobacter sp. 1_MG-2023]
MTTISGSRNVQNYHDALNSTDWAHPGEDTFNAPRQHTTTWLNATLHNSSGQALTRWLVLEPWRMTRVDAFFLSPTSKALLWQKTTGLAQPLQDRTISNGKSVIPVKLNAGETQQLLLKIDSDSLPFVSVKSWEPASYAQSIHEKRVFQIVLFACIVMLLTVLTLKFNAGLFITGLWLLIAFIFETEKDGFFSLYLLPVLENYSTNLRVSAWVFTEQLFLTTSVFLLGLHQHRFWRRFLALTAISAVVTACLTFVLDGVSIRSWGILITGLYALSWPFMIPPTLQAKRPGQTPILLLLFAYWVTSSFLLLGYTFNFYYTSAFAGVRIYVEIFIVLALILTYNWQQKRQLEIAATALRVKESESRELLEKAVENRTKELNHALETAKKANTAKVNFLGQITHDLRSPLTAILGYAQLQAVDAVSRQKANQVIQDRALYMKDLVDGLMDYARDITAYNDELRDVYLIAFIDNLVNQAHIIAGKQNNDFQFNIETELPTVIQCNSTQLQRVLLNLLDNAAKYTDNGKITLSIAFDNNQDGEPSLVFRVTDTGRGITPHQLEKIYTPFYQSSKSNPGAGLGLAICFELTKKLGGKLHLDSEPGKGTTATCTIPYIAGNEQLVSPALPVMHDFLPVFDAQGKIAWVVEDSLQIRDLLDDELTNMGFRVELFTTAEMFMEAVTPGGNVPDIIITDYHLPGASGAEVLNAARSCWPGVSVILLSGKQELSSEPMENTSETFNAYLSKPVDLREMRLTLAELCNLTSYNPDQFGEIITR